MAAPTPLEVTLVPLLSDNYAFVARDPATGAVAVVDPAEAGPMIEAVERLGGRCDLVLLTHHHGDHIDGAAAVAERFGARMVGAQADRHRLPMLDQAVAEGDIVTLGERQARVIATPGHTSGHISFHFEDGAALFCGDTLFALGCGRMGESDAGTFWDSLSKLARLPAETRIFCGHEYTLSNAKFARSVEPGNEALATRAAAVERLREQGTPTVPSTLGEELATNPFLRAGSAEEFARRRKAKDSFR